MFDSMNLQKNGMFAGGGGLPGLGGPTQNPSAPSVTPVPPTIQQPGLSGLPPDQQRKMLMAQMLVSGGAAGGSPLGALSALAGGVARGYAMNPKNSDQGFTSWAPTITQ